MDITTPLPASLRTGSTLIEVDGRPTAWLMPDGRVWPYVAGGDEGEDGDDDDDDAINNKDKDDDKRGENNDEADGATVSMTQADLDALIGKRLGEAKTRWESEAKTKADRDKMDEAERLKAEKADAEQAAKDATDKANERLVRASAKVAAIGLKVNPARVDALLRLADLTDITVDDDGEPDADAVKKAVTSALAEYPEFKIDNKTTGRSGGEHKPGGDSKPGNLQEAVAAAMT